MSMRIAYQFLRSVNDAKAIRRATRTGSGAPIARRVARRAYGKLTGQLARRLFG